MGIQIGLYDFFAYTLPGGLFLLILGYVGSCLGLFQFSFQLFNGLSTPFILVSAAIAYILGLLLEPISKKWYSLLQPRSKTKIIFKEFEALHPDLKIKIRPEDAGLMRTYIKQKNAELAFSIEKIIATGIMLRNFSLGFAVFAVIALIQFFTNGFQGLHLVMLLASSGMSVLAASESAKFYKWLHYLTLESIAAFSIDSSDPLSCKELISIERFEKEPTKLSGADGATDK